MKRLNALLLFLAIALAARSQTVNIPVTAKDSFVTITITKTAKVVPPVVIPPIVIPPVVDTPVIVRQNLLLDWNPTSPLKPFSLANGQYCCAYSITTPMAPDGKGLSIKYDLRSTDAIVSSSKRAEFQLKSDLPQESEAWYGWADWYEKYDPDQGAESIWQYHDNDGTTPPLSIQVQNGRFRVMQSFTSGNIPYDLGPIVTGQWVYFVMHVKWTTGTTGLIDVWRDGKLTVTKRNIRTNAAGGNYLKIGINKWSWAPGGGGSTTTQRIFYRENIRMGNANATFKDVDPSN